MKTLLTTMCAAALASTPVLGGVSPESFVSSLQHVMAAASLSAETHEGEIHSVAEDASSFRLRAADDQLRTFRVNEKTAFTLDGKKADASALKSGLMAKVTDESGVATRVDISSKRDPDRR